MSADRFGEATSVTPRPRLLRHALLLSALVFLLLELWRPCYFLTDDNICGTLPVFTEIGRHLWHGQSPFISDYLFGGGYNMLDDPSFLSWHPLYFIASLLAETPAHFWMIDFAAFFFLMLTTAGFVNLGWYLRRELNLNLGDDWLIFYALAFTYTFMVLATGPSWLSFLGNYSALPWLALGILQKDRRSGLALVTLFSVHHILGGHIAPLISGSLFISLFAVGVAWWRRSATPIVAWIGGNILALLIVSPMLLPAVHGFLDSRRAEGLSIDDIQNSRIPLFVFPGSYFLGTSFWLLRRPYDFHVYHPVLAASAASWCLIPALASRAKWNGLQTVCAILIGVSLLLVIRPAWVTIVFAHLPLLRSLHMPFRELLDFHLFLFLFLVLRPPAFSPAVRRAIAGGSLAIFLVPLLLYAPPSFSPMKMQRQLLFSGDMDRYWDQVKLHLKPGDKIAAVIPPEYFRDFGEWAPFSLLGIDNFCCLAKVVDATGYSLTQPAAMRYVQTPTSTPQGYFAPSQINDLWRERPDLKLIVMESRTPVRIVLRSSDGHDVDMTPYLPPEAQTITAP